MPSLKLILPQLTFTEALFADSAITESEPSTVGIFNAATLSTVDVAAIIKGIDESAKVVHIPSGNKVDEVVVGSLMQFIESSMGEYIRNGQITSADLQKREAIMLHLSADVKYVHVRGKIKALCVSKVELEMGEPATYLHELHVVNEPAYQRKGVATAYFQETIIAAKGRKQNIHLTVFDTNSPAVALYEKMGAIVKDECCDQPFKIYQLTLEGPPSGWASLLNTPMEDDAMQEDRTWAPLTDEDLAPPPCEATVLAPASGPTSAAALAAARIAAMGAKEVTSLTRGLMKRDDDAATTMLRRTACDDDDFFPKGIDNGKGVDILDEAVSDSGTEYSLVKAGRQKGWVKSKYVELLVLPERALPKAGPKAPPVPAPKLADAQAAARAARATPCGANLPQAVAPAAAPAGVEESGADDDVPMEVPLRVLANLAARKADAQAQALPTSAPPVGAAARKRPLEEKAATMANVLAQTAAYRATLSAAPLPPFAFTQPHPPQVPPAGKPPAKKQKRVAKQPATAKGKAPAKAPAPKRKIVESDSDSESESDEDEDEDDDTYEVEAIVGQRASGESGGKEYLVRWAGWSKAHDSWESSDNLKDNIIFHEYMKL